MEGEGTGGVAWAGLERRTRRRKVTVGCVVRGCCGKLGWEVWWHDLRM